MRVCGLVHVLDRAGISCVCCNLTPTSHCVFHRVDDHFGGACGALFDQTPAMTLSPGKGITTGLWRDDAHPASVWAGDMTDKGYPNDPLELEIYAGGGVFSGRYTAGTQSPNSHRPQP